MLETARDFATKHHGDQRYGDKPYTYHLDAVVALLEPYGKKAQVIGYLHDVVEDTEVTVAEVARLFGDDIAQAVAIVTDQPGNSRFERKQKTYALMAKVSGDQEIALLVKTADRLANITAGIAQGRDDKLQMYRNEHGNFRLAVYRPGLCDELWQRIDKAILTKKG